MSRKKLPQHRIEPQLRKRAKHQPLPPDETENQTIQWSFKFFDNDVKWHDDHYKETRFGEIAKKMQSYERMTWAEIRRDGVRDHAVRLDKLVIKAQKRLQRLKLDEWDFLWRLRFTGKQRLWGIKTGRIFLVLWWDPQHKVCPSRLKNT